MTLCVLLVRIRLLLALALGVRGGWKICDFAPESLGAAGSRSRGWKLNAPGIVFGEFVIVADLLDDHFFVVLLMDREEGMEGGDKV
jgi:hypothetical protein